MIPRDTTYRLASTPRDYTRCRALLREYMDPHPLSFPTIMAERHGEVIGVLGTDTKKGAVIAAPLVVRGRSIFVALRLLDAYDRVLSKAGVKAYHFHVGSDNPKWQASVKRLGFTPWHEDEAGAWFRRTLSDAA